MIDALIAMFESPGFPQGVYDDTMRDIREQSAVRERERLLKRTDDCAGRGIFGGGYANRDLERIELEESGLRGQQELGFQQANAQAALQSLNSAMGGTLGLGQLNLGSRELEVQAALERAGLALQRQLGLGNLALGNRSLGLQEQIQQAQFALQQYLLGLQFGGNPGNPAAPGGLPSVPGIPPGSGGGSTIPGFPAF